MHLNIAVPKFIALRGVLALALWIFAVSLCTRAAEETSDSPPPDAEDPAALQARVDQISKDVAEIRGLPFKHPLSMENQTMGDFEKYLDAEFSKQMPEKRRKYYGKVVKKLGLYRGPEIEDFLSLAKAVMSSQAAAYYDPNTEKFYVLATHLPAQMLGVVYSHEIYHGLQDQYWGLNDYLLEKTDGGLNEDELLARQSVVEGEASYIMNIWMMRDMMKRDPSPEQLEMTIKMQSNMDTDSMRSMVKSGIFDSEDMKDLADSVKSMDELPRFVIESLIGAYMKGMWFINVVHREGWERVEELYTNDPPSSSEQILHPEKWLEKEIPFKITWPEFEKNPLLADWELLDSNTLGEMSWRIIFEEWDMANRSKGAADGWDGDSYAVFKKKDSDDLMALIYTCWDTEGDALQFEDAYNDLLKAKYPDGDENVKVEVKGNDVLILEGGGKESTDALMGFIKQAKKKKPAVSGVTIF